MDQASIDTLRAQPVPAQGHLIGGQVVPASHGAVMETLSPIDGSVLTTLARGTGEDVARAVDAARAAFEDGRWSRQPPAARKKVMLKWAGLIEAEALALAVMGVRENGTEIGMAYKAEAGSAAATIRYYAEAIDKQSEAMEAMREGMRSLGEALAQEQQNRGQQGTQQGANQGQQRDPLGRNPGTGTRAGTEEGLLQGEDVYRRARELLEEIRRRSGEGARPEVERNYLRRLLDRF